MNAIARHAFNSTSAIAMAQSIGQVVSFPSGRAVELPHAEPESRAEIVENSIAVGKAVADAMHASVMAEAETVPAVFVSSHAVVERALLTKALEIVGTVTEKRSTVPILSNARLAAAADQIAVTATDLDIEVTVTVPAAIDATFATTLSVELMTKLLKKASKSDYVEITTHEGHADLDFERVDYRLQSLAVADFPTTERVESNHRFTMTGKSFWDGIDATIGAVSTEETRYYLNGIFMHAYETWEGVKLRMVATDGHRLYMQEFDAPAGCEGMPGVIVPRKTCETLHKLMKGKECPEDVTITVKDSAIHFAFGNVSLRSKNIDGTFPDYMRVIPTQNDKLATLEASTMLEAIESVSLISNERSRAVKLEFSGNNCRLIVNNPDSGSAKADVTCAYDCDGMEIGFNAKYLTEIIVEAAGKSGNFHMELAEAGSPARVTGQRAGWLAVLMPMRV